MKKTVLICFAILIAWLVCFHAHAQPRATRAAQAVTAAQIIVFLESYAWVRETTGYNAGPGVAILVRGGGGDYGMHPEYCGFTQAFAQLHFHLPIPRNGMQGAANAWFPLRGPDASRTLFQRAAGFGSIDSIRIGLKAGFDYGSGIHHIADIIEMGRPLRAGRAPRSVTTIAGNEGRGREAGVHITTYAISSIDALSNWNYK